jgi:hypothetical protein
MENFWWFFFNFHINLDSSVSFSYLIRLNDFLWLLYLSLNRFAVIPMYSLISPSNDFTSALYTMELDRQLLLRGQSVRFLQLQFCCNELGGILCFDRIWLLWRDIELFMLGIQL